MIYKICKAYIHGRIPHCVSAKQLCDDFPSVYVANILKKGGWNRDTMEGISCGRWGVSSFFPFKGKDYYIPKPALITEKLQTLSTAEKKALRFTHYINCLKLKEYFGASYDCMEATKEKFGFLSHESANTFFEFDKDAGVYCIICAEDKDLVQILEEMMKKTFGVAVEERLECVVTFTITDVPSPMVAELDSSSSHCITLSQIETSRFDNELDALCSGAAYQIGEECSVFNEITGEISTENSCVIEAGAYVNRTSITKINRVVACDNGCRQYYYVTISMPV